MTTKSKTQQEKHKMSEIDDNISKLFDIKKRLGKGAYGIVWKALDKRTNETVAVKKIFDAFRDETDAQRTFREIVFLKAFRNHPNVIRLLTVYRASNNLDIYLIFEYMESDLHNIIKKGTILKDIHKRYVMYQLINAIKYIHSGNVIHRDLKPSNVLIDSKCRCKLADFGLARSVSNRPMRDSSDVGSDPIVEPILTDYVATRWYRAPEILVASKRYTKGIDMWSLGCILGEMIRGKPLFQGSSTINQIEKIITALPEITDHDINAVGAGFGSVLLNKQVSRERKTSLNEMMTDAPDDAVNMVKSLLVLDPLARLTAKQALGHPYVEKFRNSIPEIELNVDILPPFRDDVRLTVPEYRSKLYEIVQLNCEKTDKRQTSSNAKINNIKQKDHKHAAPYDKSDMAKKNYKAKQNNNSEDKYISKEKYLSRPEKHESETQPSVSVPSINGKPTKKMIIISPNSKRKHGKAQSKYFTQQQTTTTEIAKSKTHSKVYENYDGHLPVNVLDKRHSIDGGYASLPDGGAGCHGSSEVYGRKSHSPSGTTLKKVDSTRRQYRSSSSIGRGEQQQVNSHELSRNHGVHFAAAQHHHHHSRERNNSTQSHAQQQQHHSKHFQQHNNYTAETEFEPQQNCMEGQNYNNNTFANKTSSGYIRNSKSDMINNNTAGIPAQSDHLARSNERLCYEKRLKKLEEEIEKYKKEVKSFCRETFSYAYQQSPHKQQQQHSGTKGHNYNLNQNRNASNQHQMQQTRIQSQQQQQQQQQQLHLGRSKYDSSNNRNHQQQQQQQYYQHQQQTQSSVPTMPTVTGSNTKLNPYHDLLAKVTRDFTNNKNGLHDSFAGGTSGAEHPSFEGIECVVDRSNHVSTKELQKQQQQQQQQKNAHYPQRHSRSMPKFIARPQISDHFTTTTKPTIANYQ